MSEEQQQDKLREQQLLQNAHNLTDPELISFMLQSSDQEKTTVELAQELLIKTDGLPGLLEIQPQPFCQIKGLEESNYVEIKACMELASRLQGFFKQVDTPPPVDETYQFLLSKVRDRGYQALFGLFLDKQRHPLALEDIIRGDVYEGEFVLKEILNKASQHQVTTFMLVHHNPTGDGCPIPIDISLSREMVKELPAMELQMLDYVVVGKFGHVSLADKGFLDLTRFAKVS
jgi:DNA repair protein RadC